MMVSGAGPSASPSKGEQRIRLSITPPTRGHHDAILTSSSSMLSTLQNPKGASSLTAAAAMARRLAIARLMGFATLCFVLFVSSGLLFETATRAHKEASLKTAFLLREWEAAAARALRGEVAASSSSVQYVFSSGVQAKLAARRVSSLLSKLLNVSPENYYTNEDGNYKEPYFEGKGKGSQIQRAKVGDSVGQILVSSLQPHQQQRQHHQKWIIPSTPFPPIEYISEQSTDNICLLVPKEEEEDTTDFRKDPDDGRQPLLSSHLFLPQCPKEFTPESVHSALDRLRVANNNVPLSPSSSSFLPSPSLASAPSSSSPSSIFTRLQQDRHTPRATLDRLALKVLKLVIANKGCDEDFKDWDLEAELRDTSGAVTKAVEESNNNNNNENAIGVGGGGGGQLAAKTSMMFVHNAIAERLNADHQGSLSVMHLVPLSVEGGGRASKGPQRDNSLSHLVPPSPPSAGNSSVSFSLGQFLIDYIRLLDQKGLLSSRTTNKESVESQHDDDNDTSKMVAEPPRISFLETSFFSTPSFVTGAGQKGVKISRSNQHVEFLREWLSGAERLKQRRQQRDRRAFECTEVDSEHTSSESKDNDVGNDVDSDSRHSSQSPVVVRHCGVNFDGEGWDLPSMEGSIDEDGRVAKEKSTERNGEVDFHSYLSLSSWVPPNSFSIVFVDDFMGLIGPFLSSSSSSSRNVPNREGRREIKNNVAQRRSFASSFSSAPLRTTEEEEGANGIALSRANDQKAVCGAVREMLRMLRVGGALWIGHVSDMGVATILRECAMERGIVEIRSSVSSNDSHTYNINQEVYVNSSKKKMYHDGRSLNVCGGRSFLHNKSDFVPFRVSLTVIRERAWLGRMEPAISFAARGDEASLKKEHAGEGLSAIRPKGQMLTFLWRKLPVLTQTELEDDEREYIELKAARDRRNSRARAQSGRHARREWRGAAKSEPRGNLPRKIDRSKLLML